MDQIKIGKFIADNRHALGLTQAQLGEKLCVSDKSVSKWERGVCLPDASLYFPLCEVLGVTVNELFAGERLPEPEQAQRAAEETIVIMAEDSHREKRRVTRLRVIFWGVLTLITALLGWGLQFEASFFKILRGVHGFLILFLFFAACYFLIWVIFGRGKKGRVEDKAAGGFLEKMAFLKAGNRPDINTPRMR